MTARARRYAPAGLLFLAVLVAWEALVRLFDIEGFILPAPSAIGRTFVTEWSDLVDAGLGTFSTAIAGLVLGSFVAFGVGLVTARWKPVRDGAMPLAIAANSTPLVVLAPIANAWFGLTNAFSTVAVVMVLVFFPIMINLVRGMTSAPQTHFELMESLATPPRTTLWKLQVPASMPYFFSGLKVAAALSLIGAVVKEYFGGPQNRVGQYITSKAALFQFEEAWSAIVLVSALGLALYLLIVWLERRVIPWHVSVRSSA